MNDASPVHPMAHKKVLFELPGAAAVNVRPDLEFHRTGAGARMLDIYTPPDVVPGRPLPTVIIVAGYPDPGFRSFIGCRFKEIGQAVCWARLIAACGMAAVTYSNIEPEQDLHALLDFMSKQGPALGLDPHRLGIWAASGNVALAMSLLMVQPHIDLKCAALCYGYMLDLAGFTGVAEAANTWHFAAPCADRTADAVRADVPLFIARAGLDEFAGLNDTLDRFIAHALAHNLPVTLVNHAAGPHAFDVDQDSAMSRQVCRQILDFLRFHLQPE